MNCVSTGEGSEGSEFSGTEMYFFFFKLIALTGGRNWMMHLQGIAAQSNIHILLMGVWTKAHCSISHYFPHTSPCSCTLQEPFSIHWTTKQFMNNTFNLVIIRLS